MGRVFIGIGTNLGDRLHNLKRSLELLAANPLVEIKNISSIYETRPVGLTEQPLFLNAVCELNTELDPWALWQSLSDIETSLGRVREIPRGPREIDLDILLFDDTIISEDELVVPHPLLAERAFVLVPLAEIAADLVHPVFGLPVNKMLEVCRDRDGVWSYGGEGRG
jgi:2-amino-4-hydroxy-6-hydroxymethyldihydropteridine diphosphokinase